MIERPHLLALIAFLVPELSKFPPRVCHRELRVLCLDLGTLVVAEEDVGSTWLLGLNKK